MRVERATLSVTLLLALCTTLLAGCGFHLRGESITSGRLANVYVVNRGSAIGTELVNYLRDAGVSYAETAAAADVVVTLSGETYERRILTLDPNTGRAREYELEYGVTLDARTREGRTLIANQRLNLVRDYIYDAGAVIGTSREEVELQQEMRRDAVQQILGRLNRTLGG